MSSAGRPLGSLEGRGVLYDGDAWVSSCSYEIQGHIDANGTSVVYGHCLPIKSSDVTPLMRDPALVLQGKQRVKIGIAEILSDGRINFDIDDDASIAVCRELLRGG